MDYQTAGTDAYILVPTDADPSVCEVIDLGCVTSIDPGTDASDQIDTTCLRDRTRRFAAGLTTPGQGSIGINADPTNAAHLKLFELSKSKKTIKFAVGWSDGTAAPTAGAGAGVATVSVTAPGTGYTSAPTVSLTGGGGTGATATATVAVGSVTGVAITNPGTGYTSAPTVSLAGGGGTGATATAALSAGGCDFALPTSRTWNTFEGYVSGFPFNFALNSVVQSDVSIQRSGDNFWYPKV
jgi:hypothetical protein